MHPRNKAFFEEVLPNFLQKTRDLYLERSLFVQLDSVKIQDGAVQVPIEKVENGLFERYQTLVSHVNNATFSTTAVQCYKTVTEQFYAPYCDDDIIQHPAVKKISEALEIPEESVTLFEVGDYRVLRVERGESVCSTYKSLTLIVQEVLQFYLDLRKPIVSIEQIFYPVEFFGPFRMVIDRKKDSTDMATVRMYSQFGTLCGKFVNVRVAYEERAVDAEKGSRTGEQPMECSQVIEKRSMSKEEPVRGSPTIRCMEKIDIDCSNIDKQETFTSMGLDSLKTAELEMAIQAEYPSYFIPTGTLLSHPTVAEMDAYLLSCACDTNVNKDSTAYSGYSPLSPQQRRLVFMCELDPESSAQFNEPVVFSMRSELFDQSRFVSTLNLLVMRHTILRTLYFGDCQVLASGTEAFIASRISHTDPGAFVALPIDVKSTSLHFALCWSADRVVVCLVFHHIAVDGYSISIITEEIKALYAGRKLAQPDGQYKDYAEKTSRSQCREQLSKWKEKLKDREFQLLPTDRRRTAKQTFNGSSVCKQLPPHLLESLKKLRNIGNCTDFSIFVAVYKFLIFKTTGIADFPVGFPSSLRGKEFMKTVGCFVNTVPLLETVDTSLTLAEYLTNFSKAVAEARAIDVPIDVLVSELKLERDDEVTPLFQVLLVMDNVDVPPRDDDIVFTDLPTRFSKYEQIWYFQRSGKSLSIKIEYNCDLFFADTMVDLLDRFLVILDKLARSAAGQPLKGIAVITASELNSLRRRNAANVCDIPFVTVLQMFRNNLSTQSLIQFGVRKMTYMELDKKSTQLAQQISCTYCAHYGEMPSRDRCAAVFMERSFNLLAVVLSIWKCGLQVVPLSLDWPVQRVMEMLEVFENPILINLNFEELRKTARNRNYPVIHEISSCIPSGKFWNVMDISDLAYITCTSGTTGKPKAVCTEFSGHCNLAPAYTKQFSINTRSCTYQVVNYGFDIFFADISKTFSNGASMILATELIPKIDEMQAVTNAYIMPAYLSSLPSTDIKRLNILESIQFGGEAIQASALEHLLQTDIHLYQEHGVTEQTVYTTANRMKLRTSISEIGKPYRNLHLLMRDPDGQLLPEKYQGMLHMNGLGITRGYYGMPALNARTISYGSFGKEFRTGDIVRYHQSCPHFTGRADLQVKIRGRIVDLTEIQNHITTHVDVAACTMAVNEDTGVKELVAYVVPRNSVVSADDLASFLRQRLPAYCLPKHFVFLEKFPLNQNGKVDKRRLPKPKRTSAAVKLRPAHGYVELAVVECFKKHTGREHMANECFFDSGGDSVKSFTLQEHRSISFVHTFKNYVRPISPGTTCPK
ncbi:AMP-binding enzyme [Ancylostoma ceylanicum]|uniref:AMP-binding enzyme n=1 Tax=Ancylostoma ceylanicum TaxID=53326 RepID=A0A0D6LSY1_9BILA|nr:AMP-binding enzyme [Ancylostoma ceylanicum]